MSFHFGFDGGGCDASCGGFGLLFLFLFEEGEGGYGHHDGKEGEGPEGEAFEKSEAEGTEGGEEDRFGFAQICWVISRPRLASRRSLETRVVTIPAVREIRSEGIWETRPSPIESRV